MPASRPPSSAASSKPSAGAQRPGLRWLAWLAGLAAALVFAGVLAVGIALSLAFPQLPDVTDLANYRPKLPLRVLSADGELLGEFGEERRMLTPLKDIPQVMINAVLATEDARFYEHSGVDYKGMVRAALTDVLGHAKAQGASTITMQVARNIYLSNEKSYLRKVYEILLTWKLEHTLGKEQILEIYMNQIFLGHRAYGFASACQVYFGKPLKDITVAQAAMLAGLPKAPSAYNPLTNPKRARARQLYIIDRMVDNGFITADQAKVAKDEPLQLRSPAGKEPLHAEYLAEMVRKVVYEQYGDDTYTRGLTVYTTLDANDQRAAYAALRRGVLDFEHRQRYRGPEAFVNLPADVKGREDTIDEVMADHPDNGELLTALVLEVAPRKVRVVRGDDDPFDITGDGLKPVQSGLADNAPANIKLRPGAVVRVIKDANGNWSITQLPEVQSAFVAADPRTGEIRALVGGFDFNQNKFNHVTQAWRQPGSSFKPFIYSAALEKGVTPATVVDDGPLYFPAGPGGKAWEPKNYDGKFEGPMTVRTALAKSKNMVSIRILQTVGPNNAQEWIKRFGFDADKHPPYLTMALGAGSVTPMQMASAYSVFANGGYYVPPVFISKITDYRGNVLQQTPVHMPDESQRVIEPRNAFVMDSLLNEVARSGTAARAQATLKRPDLYGKTGTTNDSMDAWFVGFQPTLVGAVWFGYDTPRNLGSRETGGGLSLPIWISFMQEALRNVPVAEMPVPAGVVNTQGDWFFEEFAPGHGVAALTGNVGEVSADSAAGGTAPTAAPAPTTAPPSQEEKRSILDLFKN